MIKVPKMAIELAKRFEGFERRVKRGIDISAIPYICPAGFWTIGYGHLCDPKHPPITEAEAEVHLARDLQTALAATLRYCPVLATESEGRLAAIVDFTFNLGAGRLQTSTLRRRVNQRDWTAASQELRRWVYGGGRVLSGLVTRREAEATWLLRNT
ncbi:lysozyme [Rhodoferax sp. AJA081-3]|uniref:lysozyme n=1 Tax=Rhodoferax sp. AJA081-3 TaxID=2752316 RepID=UPI001ADF7D01|nr:lysozyme [Rhodoferax sp. AJA081-3]QTN29614.1 lysozyme [Rhodoferax sp. AJA081-3]